MLCYRLYFMHSMTGHIERSVEFDASDDQAATHLACKHLGDLPLELWSGHRRVLQIPALELFPSTSVAQRN